MVKAGLISNDSFQVLENKIKNVGDSVEDATNAFETWS
jgi:hypothetical protein